VFAPQCRGRGAKRYARQGVKHLERLKKALDLIFITTIMRAWGDDFLRVENDPELADLQRCMATPIEASLYAAQAIRLQCLQYVESAKAGVKTCYFHNFEADAVKDFKHLMKREVDILVAAGHESFVKKVQTLSFLVVPKLSHEITHLADEWKNLYSNEVKGIGINSGQFPRLPWEVLLWGQDPIPGLPQAMVLPREVVEEFLPCRKAALGLLGGGGDGELTTKDMIKTMTQNFKKLKSVNRTWDLERIFLIKHVEGLLLEQIVTSVLDTFPDFQPKTKKINLDAPQTAIQEALSSRTCAALDIGVAKEFKSVASMLSNLAAGIAPLEADISTLSSFHRRVLKACEIYCWEQVEVVLANGKARGKVVKFGKDALLTQFAAVEAQVAAGANSDPGAFQNFRRFSWLLDKAQRDQVDLWIRGSLKRHREAASRTVITIADDPGRADAAPVPTQGSDASTSGGSAAASSSRTSSIVAVKRLEAISSATSAAAKVQNLERDKIVESQRAAMARLFGSKAKINA